MFERIAALFREIFDRIRRRTAPAPGYFVSGRKLSLRGPLHSTPWLWPSREYLLYVPRGYGGWKRRALVVMLHGCRQTPEEFAAATRITTLADVNGWLVLLPRQSDKANTWSCWNWFDAATSAGRGEAAIVVAQVRAVRRQYRVHPRRIFVAGFSSGGGLAAALGVRHTSLFAGVFVHSGLACNAASGPATALDAMRRGANTDPERIGEEARSASGPARLPLRVVHGDADDVVAEINAVHLVRQFLALNGRARCDAPRNELPRPDVDTANTLPGGRSTRSVEYRDGRRLLVHAVWVAGLGHAWSGGDAAFPFNDPAPPDATAELGRFVTEQSRAGWK
jgi:poly(hydroxyalkanoate) depolymerase family esterase